MKQYYCCHIVVQAREETVSVEVRMRVSDNEWITKYCCDICVVSLTFITHCELWEDFSAMLRL